MADETIPTGPDADMPVTPVDEPGQDGRDAGTAEGDTPAAPGTDGEAPGAAALEGAPAVEVRAGFDPFPALAAIGSNPAAFAGVAGEAERAAREIFVRRVASRGLGIAGLRAVGAAVGAEAFAELAKGMRQGDVSRLLAAVDPHKPGLQAMDRDRALSRLVALSAGAEPAAAADPATMDLPALRALHGALGDDFGAWVAALKGGEARKAAARLDPARPGVQKLEPDEARAHLAALAGGMEPTVAVRVDEVDLEGLRAARTHLGDGFATWLASLRQGDAKKALARIDPHRPGLGKLDADGVRGALADLADDVEPTAAIPLDELDLAGLAAARESAGPEAFEAWLDDLKPADAKRAVIRLDPERPGVRKLGPGEYREALASLAERMSPHAGGRRVPGVGDITFGRARHDEDTYPLDSD